MQQRDLTGDLCLNRGGDKTSFAIPTVGSDSDFGLEPCFSSFERIKSTRLLIKTVSVKNPAPKAVAVKAVPKAVH